MALLDQILNGVTSLTGLNRNEQGNAPAAGTGDQGGLGGLGGIVGGLVGGGTTGKILPVLLSMLASGKFGGLEGLLKQFNNNGMQNQLTSWVSTRPNETISSTQVEQALGQDTVAEIAQKAGVDQTEAAQGLADVIPQLVDKMTPTGTMPQQDVISDVLGKLGGRF